MLTIEERLAALEKNSHPPVDLAPAIREYVAAEFRKHTHLQSTDRENDRAAVDAGYMELKDYVAKWGKDASTIEQDGRAGNKADTITTLRAEVERLEKERAGLLSSGQKMIKENAALHARAEKLHGYCLILLSNLDWLTEYFGEGVEGEDAVLVNQIRASLTEGE